MFYHSYIRNKFWGAIHNFWFLITLWKSKFDFRSIIDLFTLFSRNNKYSALIYFCLKQPNMFMSKDHLGQRVQISCFDLSLKLSGPEYQALNHIPTEDDFPVNLLETRSGVPDASTGILPAFFTMKFSKVIGKSSTLDIEISKPTKIRSSLTKWSYLLTVKDKVTKTFFFCNNTQQQLTKIVRNKSVFPQIFD